MFPLASLKWGFFVYLNMENAEIIFYPVPGYADLFEVNEAGTHVKIKEHIRWTNGYRTRFKTIPEEIRDDFKLYDGKYYSFNKFINGKSYCIRIHVLVCLAFYDNPQNKPEVNHKDTDKLNNHKDNIEWSTRPENAKHAKENKLYPTIENKKWHDRDDSKHAKGITSPKSILKPSHVLLIRSSPFNNRELSEHYNVQEACIWKIRARRTWKHI